MKTIKDIITRKNKYTDIVDDAGVVLVQGREMSKNIVSNKKTIHTYYDKTTGVCIEKYQIEVCGYSKIRQYRRMEGGYRPYLQTFYTYTYPEGNERLKSKNFKSMKDLIKDMKKKTFKVEMGATTMKVLQSE